MSFSEKKCNRLIHEPSPYLLQHAYNPVDWFPWGEEAFAKAQQEDKPIFLSIGYSTCHWCHVMAHESFEDKDVADILNAHFICIKVDKEERPDIDSIYMSVCQTMTGSGGWPLSIFMTPDQKPFFAGTYFPRDTAYGTIGFPKLLHVIHQKWQDEKQLLTTSADDIITFIELDSHQEDIPRTKAPTADLTQQAAAYFECSYDQRHGGFGQAPKFPSAHNLLFLLNYSAIYHSDTAMAMAEHTLIQMYKGGLFDHIGGGFSRYSTDAYFLVPHFEKMLYDNALLMYAYTCAYQLTGNPICRLAAEKTATYVLTEMTHREGGFYCAQDADSDGNEGKFYVFSYDEILSVLGKKNGKEFADYYGITGQGNFEGKNILNLLHHNQSDKLSENPFAQQLDALYQYRKTRTLLHLDDKILTSWNALMIAAFSVMYQVFGRLAYLTAAECAAQFIESHLRREDTLLVSYRNGQGYQAGFLDDYAAYIFALIHLYDITYDKTYYDRAAALCRKTITDFSDRERGGFFLYGEDNEQLILKPKEVYDGAVPSGNSLMAFNLMRLSHLSQSGEFAEPFQQQMKFMATQAASHPAGHSFFLIAALYEKNPPEHIVCVIKNKEDLNQLRGKTRLYANVVILEEQAPDYPLVNDRTTFYICRDHVCLPPVNHYEPALS
mgnify:CR=1 FL=1